MSRLAAAHAAREASEDASDAFLHIGVPSFEESIDDADLSLEVPSCQASGLSFEEFLDEADCLVLEPVADASRINEVLLCGDDCVRCGACFGDAGDACAFEGASVVGPRPDMSGEAQGGEDACAPLAHASGKALSTKAFAEDAPAGEALPREALFVEALPDGLAVGAKAAGFGSMLDEESLAAKVAEVFEQNGFPAYAARFAAQAAVETACEMWHPCRVDGALNE